MSARQLVAATHVGLGLICVCAPGRTARAVRGRPGQALRATIVVLGVRHLIEAPVAGRRSRRWALTAAVVDGVHAATMVGLAALRPPLRHAAHVNAAVAATLAVAEAMEARAVTAHA
jgi:hypothetical protein